MTEKRKVGCEKLDSIRCGAHVVRHDYLSRTHDKPMPEMHRMLVILHINSARIAVRIANDYKSQDLRQRHGSFSRLFLAAGIRGVTSKMWRCRRLG